MSVTLRLLRSELRLFWLSYTISVIFFLLYSLFLTSILDDALTGDTMSMYILDFIMLMFGQVFGLGFSKYNLMNPFRHDPYTKKMRALRRLPIPSSAIVHSRILLLIVVAAVNTTLFLLPAYFLSSEAGKVIAWPDYVSFIFLLYCFSVVMGSFYVSLELGQSGKRYWLYSSAAFILTIVLQVLLVVGNKTITVWLLSQIGQWHASMYAVITLITIGIVSLLSRWTNRRVMRRDYQ